MGNPTVPDFQLGLLSPGSHVSHLFEMHVMRTSYFLGLCSVLKTQRLTRQSRCSRTCSPLLRDGAHGLGDARGWYDWGRHPIPMVLLFEPCHLLALQASAFRCHFLRKPILSLSLIWCFLCVPMIFCTCGFAYSANIIEPMPCARPWFTAVKKTDLVPAVVV